MIQNINTTILEKLTDYLQYHNFTPRLPVRENGYTGDIQDKDVEHTVHLKDIELLASCDLLITILLFNDSGTLVELGMFKSSGKPIIIFDPHEYCKNMFVRHAPDYLCKSLNDIIETTYQCLGRR